MESRAEVQNGDGDGDHGADSVEDGAVASPSPSPAPEESAEPIAEEPAYIGDNCLSTPADTETNSPRMDTEPDPEDDEPSERTGDVDSVSESSAGVSGATTADDDRTGGDADVPSIDGDEETGGNVSGRPTDASSEPEDPARRGENPSVSSSGIEGGDPLPCTKTTDDGLAPAETVEDTATLRATVPEEDGDRPPENVDSRPDASVLSTTGRRPQFARPPAADSTLSHATVSSSNTAIGAIHHRGSSIGAESTNTDESAISSSMNSNGGASVNTGTHDAADALATLASAALNRQHSAKETKTDQEEPWYTVGIVKGTSYTVHHFIADPDIDLSKLTLDSLPDLSGYPVISLDAGTGYKFRVAAINSCGRGEFGEESAFKTCVPGYPGAPSAIKITKSSEGAHLSWEPPQMSAEGIFEYSVYLAVKPSLNTALKDPAVAKSQLTFVRVYCGKANTCIVSQVTLGNAHVDNSTKPAIIFRIAARNDKGYGPATQVRWLQENKSSGVKRILADGRPPGTPPLKQQKLNII